MPQLDQFTYLTQFVWLCVSFMSFYILLYKDGLPKIARILKLRSKLVSQQNPNQSGILSQSEQPSSSELVAEQQAFAGEDAAGVVATMNTSTNSGFADVVIKESLNGCAFYLNASVSGASEWCNKTVIHLNNANAPLNITYVKSLGDMSVSQIIKRNTLDKLTALLLVKGQEIQNKTSSSVTEETSNPLIRLNRIFMLRLRPRMGMGFAQKKASISTSTKEKLKNTDSSGGPGATASSSSLNTSRKKRSQNA
jgi:hypothetical protein